MPEREIDLRGAIDLHVHAGPDVRPRKMTAVELSCAAKAAGMRGLLLKHHHTSTVSQAASIREQLGGFSVFGGLALNEAVGGWNPAAVEAALKMGAAEIWMPTHGSANEKSYRGHTGTGLSLRDDDGRVREILRLIAEADAILGTGHLAPAEIAAIIPAARAAGVSRILVTHPEIQFVNLPVAMQKELAGPGVYFERCYYRAGFTLDWDGLAASIREVGVGSTVLATDLGQPENADPVSGLREMLEQFAARGFTRDELETMACRNPAILLGLD